MVKAVVIFFVVIAVGALGYFFFNSKPMAPGKFDDLAKCLGEKGAIFYGAFGCPHCQNQKAMFGSSARLLPYVECSTPDSRGQKPECGAKDIKGYPTWVFADESRLSGEISLAELAKKTDCTLPN